MSSHKETNELMEKMGIKSAKTLKRLIKVERRNQRLISEAPTLRDIKKEQRRIRIIAKEILGTENSTKEWMNKSQIILGDKKPIEYMATLSGCKEVEKVLRRIEQGIIV